MGELLATMERKGVGQPPKSIVASCNNNPSLADLGIERTEAVRCQRIAEVPRCRRPPRSRPATRSRLVGSSAAATVALPLGLEPGRPRPAFTAIAGIVFNDSIDNDVAVP